MSLSTYAGLWRQVLLRCPMASPFLCQEWIQYRFRNIVERRKWSWLICNGQFVVNAAIQAGTVDVTRGSASVVGTGTGWDASVITRQFRTSYTYPIYTILDLDVGTQTLTLHQAWGGSTATGQGYKIWQAYYTVPSDFHAFTTVVDPAYNWQLWLQIQQAEINMWDAQRSNQGTSWVVAPYDYCDSTFANPPLPRYEFWPHTLVDRVYPFLYESRPADLNDADGSLPRYIPGDVLLEGALADAARWPGPSKDRPNPYFNLGLAMQHEQRFLDQVYRLEVQDDEVQENNVQYGGMGGLPFATIPMMDARWLQSHGSIW